MRSLLLSIVLGAAALGVVALTPSQAEATWRRAYYGGYHGYYGAYYPHYRPVVAPVYYPRYTYVAPVYGAFYTPVVRPYMPAYTYYAGPRIVYPAPGVVYYPRVW